MPDPEGLWSCCSSDRTVYYRVQGKSTLRVSSELRRCAEERIADGATAVRIDLRRCDYVDSTFVGTLLVIKNAADAHGSVLTVLEPSAGCREVFGTMGLDRVLNFGPADEPDAEWSCIVGTPEVDVCRRDVADAHQALADTPGPAGETFKPIAERMAQEQRSRREDGSKPAE